MKYPTEMDLPHLSVNMAMTLDGKVALPDGRWHGMSSAEDRRRMSLIRSQSDALIMGTGSVENDDPDPCTREGKSPVPVIIARKRLPSADKKIFRNPETIFYASSSLPEKDLEPFRSLCRLKMKDPQDLEPETILRDLYASGFRRVLLEGGPVLNHSFFKKNLISRIYLTLVPFIIGRKALPGIVDGEEAFFNFEKKSWKAVFCEKVDDEIFLCYERISE